MKTLSTLQHRTRGWIRLTLLGLGVTATLSAGADSVRLPGHVPPAYATECAACHVALPPSLLPAPSWQRLMNGLDQHYGTDASLDAATVAQLSAWLQTHAGAYDPSPPQDRITRSAWFERKHRKVEAAVWQLPSVKSPVNCAACHSGAERGHFDDDFLKQPAGLNAAQRRAWND